MQAATGHPLTVHGTGGQTRAFIHIKDTIQCIKLAIENPPQKNDPVKIFNQTTEQHNVRKLAEKISSMTGAEIRYFVNPRKEDRDNDLRLSCKNFLELGLKPITLNDGLMNEIHDIASKYQNRCDKSKIICTSVWQKEMIVDHLGSSFPIIERSVQKNI
jgi:UDP-sulfoquinovose synthase